MKSCCLLRYLHRGNKKPAVTLIKISYQHEQKGPFWGNLLILGVERKNGIEEKDPSAGTEKDCSIKM